MSELLIHAQKATGVVLAEFFGFKAFDLSLAWAAERWELEDNRELDSYNLLVAPWSRDDVIPCRFWPPRPRRRRANAAATRVAAADTAANVAAANCSATKTPAAQPTRLLPMLVVPTLRLPMLLWQKCGHCHG